MSVAALLFKEIRFRWLSFLLGLFAVAAAVTLFVALLSLERASEDETRRLMRDLGFNLVIVPKDTNMEDFWASDYADKEMPEEYVERVANAKNVSAEHYVAMLRKRVAWRGKQVLLTGVLPELGALGKKKKSPMGFQIPPGSAYVGYELWRSLGISDGDTVEVLGKRLKVVHCMFELGSKDDISLYAHLHDVQAMLGKPGRINTIQALGCMCYGERLPVLRQQLNEALPEAKVSEMSAIAEARLETRHMVAQYGGLILLIVLIVGTLWVAVLSFLNVREREQEIGILRALGIRSGQIASLFLWRAVLTGLVGAVVGFAAGTMLCLQLGPGLFKITHAKIAPLYPLLGWSVLVAPLVAAAASFLPTMAAVTQDPAVTLVRE